MNSFLAFLIAALAGCLALYAILDWSFFRRVVADRFTGRIMAGLTTYVVSVLVYGFGASGGSTFHFEGFLIFLIPSLAILAFAVKQAREERAQPAQDILGSAGGLVSNGRPAVR